MRRQLVLGPCFHTGVRIGSNSDAAAIRIVRTGKEYAYATGIKPSSQMLIDHQSNFEEFAEAGPTIASPSVLSLADSIAYL
jgi:hypothetical protein